MSDPLIIEEYLRAVYSFAYRGGRVEFSFDPGSIAGSGKVAIEVAGSWAIISARDPMSRKLDDETNRRREGELDARLLHLRLPSALAEGRSADGVWREPSRVVFGADRLGALALARGFEQRAIVWGERGGVGLLDCLTERWTIRPTFGIVGKAVDRAVFSGL